MPFVKHIIPLLKSITGSPPFFRPLKKPKSGSLKFPLTHLFLSVFLVCAGLTVLAQKEGNIWYFGTNAGLDFNYSPPKALLDGKLYTNEGCSSVSDKNGKLLFYTDGSKVYCKDHSVMPQGTGLTGNSSSTQSSIVVPAIGQPSKYYIFTIKNNVGPEGLNYSVVNMDLNAGLGDVETKNVAVLTPTTEKLTAIRHANNRDYWIVTERHGVNEIHAYLLTSNGLSTTPVVNSSNKTVSSMTDGVAGYMKANPQGNKLALAYYRSGPEAVVIYDFDNRTGKISDPITINNFPEHKAYGLEFSPDGKLLYVTNIGLSGTNLLYQFDLTYTDGSSMMANAFIDTTDSHTPTALQLAPDGKIYFGLLRKPFLGVIHSPDQKGVSCDIEVNYVDLLGREVIWGLPNFPTSALVPSYNVVSMDVCLGDTTWFSFTGEEPDSVKWDLGDGISTTSNTAYRIFGETGLHTVHLTIFYDTETIELEAEAMVYAYPDVDAGKDQLLCGDKIELVAIWSEGDLLWSTGDQTANIFVNTVGMYWVEADHMGCKSRDTVSVDACTRLVMPNVFTPSIDLGDGLNDVFLPIEMEGIRSAQLLIFNRWGERLFMTEDIMQGWDGTSYGRNLPDGTYFWIVNYQELEKPKSVSGSLELIWE